MARRPLSPPAAEPAGEPVPGSAAWVLSAETRGGVADRAEFVGKQQKVSVKAETPAGITDVIIRRGADHAVVSKENGRWVSRSTRGDGLPGLSLLLGLG